MKTRLINQTLILVALLALPMLTSAALVTLKTADASGFSSFTGATNWSNGAIPSSGNDYSTFTSVVLNQSGMRTPGDTANYTFGGSSLTLSNAPSGGYSLLEKSSAASGVGRTLTINNLTNAPGALIRSGGTVGSIITITGNVYSVSGNSTILADQCNWVINSPLAGSGILTNTFASSQTTTYGGNNSAFTGGLIVSGGTVKFTSPNAGFGNPAASNPGQITLGASSTLQDNAGITLNGANGGITLAGAATLNTATAGSNTVVAVPVTGAFALTKGGAGILTLSGSNSFSGGLTLSGATAGSQLNLNSTNALGTGTFTINSGNNASLDNTSGSPLTNLANNAQSWANDFTFKGSSSLNLGTGAVTLGANRGVTVNANALTVGGIIGGAFGLTKAGPGTLALTASNTFSGGTTISAGTLVMGNPNALGTNGVTFSGTANATLDIATDGSDFTNVVNAGSGTTFTIASDVKTGSVGINHTMGTFLIGSGSTPLQMNVIAGPNVASGSPQITAPLTLSGGTGGTTIINPTTASITFASVTATSSSKTLQLDGTNTGSSITGAITDGGANVISLTKANTGTWTLGGANTYSGTTTVSNGALVVTGSLGTNTTTVVGGTLALSGSGSVPSVFLAAGGTYDVTAASGSALTSGETLAGKGFVNGNFSTSSGGQILPGGSAAIGTLTFNNNLNLAGGETVKFDFNGGSNDVIVVGGSLTPGGTTTINLATGANALANSDYVLFQISGSLNGGTNNFTVTGTPSPSRQKFVVAYDTSSSPKRVLLHVSGTAASLVWQGGLNGNVWDITSTYNWLNGVSSDVYFDGDTVNFTDAGATNQPVLNVTVAPGSVNFNSSNNYNLTGTGKISDGAGLTKSGTGTLTISTTNDYTGVTTLNGGIVSVGSIANGGSASPLGAASSASANLVLNGGTLQYTGATAGSDHGATLGVSGGTIALGSSGVTLTLGGVITGSSGGALTKTGNDTLVLSGANNYDGGTVISGGTLQVGAGGATGSLGAGSITDNGALVVNRTGTLILTNGIGGSGSVTNNGPGTLVLGPTNTFAGMLVANTGIVQVATAPALGVTPVTFNPAKVGINVGELEATASFNIDDTNTGIGVVAGTIGVDSGATVTIANPITSVTSLTKSRAGTLILTGSNTLAGVLNVDTASQTASDGALRIASTNALGGVPIINIRNNQSGGSSTLQLDGTAGSVAVNPDTFTWSGRNNFVPAVENIAGDNIWNPSTVTFNSGGAYYTFQCDAGSLTLPGSFPTTAPSTMRNILFAGNGDISVPGSIASASSIINVVKTNSGTLTLWGLNSYTGLTSIQGGTVNVADGASFGNTTINATNGNIELAPYTGQTATLNISNATVNAQRVIIGGVTANSGTPGTGTLNQFSGTLDSYQWFTVGSGGTTGGSGTYNLSGGTLNVHVQQMEVGNFTAASGTVNMSGGAINIWNNNYLTLGANANAGPGTFVQSGGTVTLYSDAGGTVGGTGVLMLGRAAGLTNTYAYWLNGGTLGVPTIATVSGNSQFYFNGGILQAAKTNAAFMVGLAAANVSTNGATIDSSSYPVTIAQALIHDPALGATADGGLTNQGSGTLTLAGTNTYTGPTTVNSGTLLVNGSIAGGAVTVNGGTLGGAGTINGATTLTSGTIAPAGSAIGTFTISNSLTLQGGTVRFDLTKTSNDVLAVSSAVNVTGSANILLNFPAPGLGTYTLIPYGSLSGFENLSLSLAAPNPRYSFTLTNDTAAGAIKVVVTGISASLVWRGDGSFNGWDNAGGYQNWYNGGPDYFYDGDAVTFDNTGSNTPSIYLTTAVSPSSVTVASTNDYDFAGSGSVTSPGNLTKSSAGKLTLEVDNTYAATTIGAGTVQIGNGSTTGSLTTGSLTNNGTLAFNRSDTVTYATSINGSGGVAQAGSGTLVLAASNSYAGPTVISSGILLPHDASALGAAGTIATNGGQLYIDLNFNFPNEALTLGGGALRKGGGGVSTMGGSVTLVSNTVIHIDGGATLNLTNAVGISGIGSSLELNGDGGSVGTIAGPISLGTGGFTKNGVGTWTLGPSNNFTGLTALNAGTLRITGGSLGNPAIFTPNQITLAGAALEAVSNSIFADGLAGFTLTADTTMMVDSGATLVISNELAGANALTKSAVGTLVLATSNSFSGTLNVDTGSTTGSDGITRLASPNALAAVTTIQIRNNQGPGSSTLQLDGTAGSITLGQTFNWTGRNNFVPAIENIAGSNTWNPASVTLNVGGGFYQLASASGTLTIPATFPNTGPGTARTLVFGGAGNINVTGVIQDGGSIISILKTNAGTLMLANNNTYGNATTIGGGVLLLTGSITSTGAVTVAGGTLSGTGTVNDKVAVQSGGTLSPSLGLGSIGTLTINSNLTLAGTVAVDISKTAGTNDLVTGLNSVTYGGTLAVTNLAGTLSLGDSFTLFSAAASSGNFTNIVGSPGAGLAYSFTNGVLSVVTGIASNPTNITATVSGGTLTLSWPADHTGWILQAQTNNLSAGLSTNWVDVAGSSSNHTNVITISPSNPAVFYRLRLP
jgi:autotransporter-associated beta strand protein